MATIRITYFGVEGEGPTVKAAKQDAGDKLERFVKGSMPRIYCHKGYTLITYAQPWGGSYTITHPDSAGQAIGSSSASDRRDAEFSGLRHLFTMARKEGEYEIPDWAMANRDFAAMAKSLRDEWARNDKFQAAYREARSLGQSDCEAHLHACQAA